MKRRLFTILSALSLVLCIGTTAMWVRSYWVRDIVGLGPTHGNIHLVQSILGRLHVLSHLDGGYSGGISYSSDRLSAQAIWQGGMSNYPDVIRWRIGCAYETYTGYMMDQPGLGFPGMITHHRLIVLPYAYPATAFAAAPAILLFKRWCSRRSATRGLCRTCGYDLRATPDRCPECGTPIPADLVRKHLA